MTESIPTIISSENSVRKSENRWDPNRKLFRYILSSFFHRVRCVCTYMYILMIPLQIESSFFSLFRWLVSPNPKSSSSLFPILPKACFLCRSNEYYKRLFLSFFLDVVSSITHSLTHYRWMGDELLILPPTIAASHLSPTHTYTLIRPTPEKKTFFLDFLSALIPPPPNNKNSYFFLLPENFFSSDRNLLHFHNCACLKNHIMAIA